MHVHSFLNPKKSPKKHPAPWQKPHKNNCALDHNCANLSHMVKALIKYEDQPSESKTFDVSIGTRSDPRSVINLVPPEFQKAMESVPQELVHMDEHGLKLKIKPNPTINRLRISFWSEYNRAQEAQTNMNISKVYSGICGKEFFYQDVLPNSFLVSWIICPPAEYTKALQEVLYEGVEQLRDIITRPIKKSNGTYDDKAIDQIIKVYILVEQRLKGAIIQKQEIKSAHMHIKAGDMGNITKHDDLEAIRKRIAEIERENKKSLATRSREIPIDSEPLESDD